MQYTPKNLYRFRPLGSASPNKSFEEERLERICNEISERRLFAARVSDLNDPFEGVGVLPYVASAGSGIHANLGFLPPSAKDYTNGLRLISMTERYNSPQMWAHYATSYCGVCMCFDTTFLGNRIDAVRYSDLPIVEHGYRADRLIVRKDEIAPSALLVKQNDWAYEQEWRAIIREDETDGGFVSYGEHDLWAVIVGHNTPEEAKAAIGDACTKIGASVYITAPQELRYRLGIWPDGFKPSFDGRSIEQEIDEFCMQANSKPFEMFANCPRQ